MSHQRKQGGPFTSNLIRFLLLLLFVFMYFLLINYIQNIFIINQKTKKNPLNLIYNKKKKVKQW